MKTTTKTTHGEGRFLNILTACWTKTVREGREDRDARLRLLLADRLGVDEQMVGALLEGFEVLATYAVGGIDDGDVLGEEENALHASREAVRPVFEARLQQRLSRIDEAVPLVRCARCNEMAVSEGLRTRSWLSQFGTIRARRRYNGCKPCGCGRMLAQERVGLGDGMYTPRLAESITKLATVVPHAMAVELTSSLLGAEISVHGVEELVKERAAFVEARAAEEAETLDPWDDKGLQRPIIRPADAVREAPDVAYMETDGVIVMTRREDPERAVPAPPGSRGGKGRRYELEGREVKNAIVYRGDDCARESETRGCLLDKRYVSYLGGWREFAKRVWPTLLRERFDQARLRVVLSDGSEWIRLLCAWFPFTVLMILDLFHVKHRIWEVAQALHRDDEAARAEWARAQIARVEAGEGSAVIEALRFVKPRGETARKLVDDLGTYLANNLDRMDYPRYRAMGLRVGSGAIESSNYHVTGARLKMQGMRWSEAGAADMAQLRAELFNRNWRARTRDMMAA